MCNNLIHFLRRVRRCIRFPPFFAVFTFCVPCVPIEVNLPTTLPTASRIRANREGVSGPASGGIFVKGAGIINRNPNTFGIHDGQNQL